MTYPLGELSKTPLSVTLSFVTSSVVWISVEIKLPEYEYGQAVLFVGRPHGSKEPEVCVGFCKTFDNPPSWWDIQTPGQDGEPDFVDKVTLWAELPDAPRKDLMKPVEHDGVELLFRYENKTQTMRLRLTEDVSLNTRRIKTLACLLKDQLWALGAIETSESAIDESIPEPFRSEAVAANARLRRTILSGANLQEVVVEKTNPV